VIPSKVQVLTNVGLEHTRWLGPTVEDIAREKLDVVRDHAVLVTGPLPPAVEEIASEVAAARHARRRRVTTPWDGPLRAAGRFQRRNFALAVTAAEAFLGDLGPAAVPNSPAIEEAARAVRIPGRLEAIADAPLTLVDGAHNPDGARALAEAVPDVIGDRLLTGVVAILEDKEAAEMLKALLPLFDHVVFTRASNPRSLPLGTLESLARQLEGPESEAVADPRAALARARERAGEDGAVLATGSIYLIADLVAERSAARASRL
jgi:dihydrofolate synthase/folylpolyglutamate synthase